MPVPVDIRGLLQRLGPGGMLGGGIPGQQPGPTQPQFQPPPAYANLQNMGGQYSQLAQLLGTGQSAGSGRIGDILANVPMNKYNGNARGSVIPGQPPIGGALGGHMQIPTPITGGPQAQLYPRGLLGYGGK